MSNRVNLLPPEVRRARRDAGLVRRIRFVALCLVLLLGGIYGIGVARLLVIRGELEDLRVQQESVRSSITALADVAGARDGVAAYRGYVAQVLAGEILWSDQMLRVAQAVPPGFTLSSLSGVGAPDAGNGIVGSLTFSGSAPRIVDARSWLSRIATTEGWANGWLGSVQGGTDASVTLAGTVDLTTESLSQRGRGGA